jgi:hypothetical protein
MKDLHPLESEFQVNLIEQWKHEYEAIIKYVIEKSNELKSMRMGTWSSAELDRLYNTISLFSEVMGGRDKFIQNLGQVYLRRANLGVHRGEAGLHSISFSNQGTFSPWTVIHEFAHAWDANYGWRLSRMLESYTGGFTSPVLSFVKQIAGLSDSGFLQPETRPSRYGRKPGCNRAGYFYGDKPSGSNWSFNRIEDFAECVAMYIGWGRGNELSQHAQNRIARYQLNNGDTDSFNVIDNWADYARYFYPENGDYTKTKRWQFIDDLVKGKLEIN